MVWLVICDTVLRMRSLSDCAANICGSGDGGYGIIGAYDANFDAECFFATTLSANITVDNLTFIPELRLDVASEEGAFENANLEPSSSLASFLLAAVYSF